MTHDDALTRIEEKLVERIKRAEKNVREADGTLMAPYERGFLAATKIALEDVRTFGALAAIDTVAT